MNLCPIPKHGNLDLPEGERLSVEIIRPTAEDHDTLVFVEVVQQNKRNAKDTDVITTTSHTRFNAPKILRRHVGEIKNLVIEDVEAGTEKSIASGEELASASFAGMFPLVNAICIEVCADKITNAQKKISESPSASSGTDGTSGNPAASTPTKK